MEMYEEMDKAIAAILFRYIGRDDPEVWINSCWWSIEYRRQEITAEIKRLQEEKYGEVSQ